MRASQRRAEHGQRAELAGVASVKIDAVAGGLERERAPLAVVLVVDSSGSMQGEPIAHAIQSCEILADLLGERDLRSIVTFAQAAALHCGLTAVGAAGCSQLRRALRATGSTAAPTCSRASRRPRAC